MAAKKAFSKEEEVVHTRLFSKDDKLRSWVQIIIPPCPLLSVVQLRY